MPTRQAKAYSEDVLVASAARTTSSDSGAIDGFSDSDTLSLLLDVTAVTGTTPTLNVALEHSYDGGTTWFELSRLSSSNLATTGRFTLDVGPGITTSALAAITPLSGTTAHSRAALNAIFSNNLRIKWVIGGTATPTFTFSVRSISQSPQT